MNVVGKIQRSFILGAGFERETQPLNKKLDLSSMADGLSS